MTSGEPRQITADDLNRARAVLLRHGGSYRYAAVELAMDEARLRRLIPPAAIPHQSPKRGKRR